MKGKTLLKVQHLFVCQNENQTDINQLFLSEDKNSIEQMAKQVREALERKQIDVTNRTVRENLENWL